MKFYVVAFLSFFLFIFYTCPLDVSAATYSWTKTMGGVGDDHANSVIIDNLENIFITGQFDGSVDFDPGAGTDNHTSVGGNDVFLTKINSDNTYGWTHTIGGLSNEQANSVATDTSGNIFITGQFEGTVDFDPTVGTDNHSSAGISDIFLTKINSDGTYGWTKTMGGLETDSGSSIDIDANGNVYIVGTFRVTVDFDPSATIDSHTSLGAYNVFLTKFNSDGTYGWTKTMGASSGAELVIDASGNRFITGRFLSTVDFDPGAGTDNHSSIGSFDIYLTKINSDDTYAWTKTLGGVETDDAYALAVDLNENIYFSGVFANTVDFNPGVDIDNHTSNGVNDTYLTKINSDGTYGWTKTLGGTGYEYGKALTVDSSNNVYLSGGFEDTVDFNPSVGIDNGTSEGSIDVFFTKFSSDGIYVWTRTFGGIGGDIAESITLDSNGNLYVVGYFTDTVDFDPGASIDIHTSAGFTDAFLTKFTKNNIPVTYNDSIGMNEGVSFVGNLSASDVDGDSLTYTIVSNGTNGVATITNSATGAYTYTPNAGAIGFDTFTFKVNDGLSDSNIATVDVTIISDTHRYDWTKTIGEAPNHELVFSVATDSTNNIYMVGTFEDTIDFDPSEGIDNHTSVFDKDIYITRINSDGTYGWTKNIGSESVYNPSVNSIAIDSTDNIFITGNFSDTMDFDSSASVDSHTPVGSADIYLTKIASDGTYGWTKTMGGTMGGTANSVAIDNEDNIYLSGAFSGSKDFDPSAGIDNHTSIEWLDIFLTKINYDGSYGWTKTMGGTDNDIAYSVSIDSTDNIYLAGYFAGGADFDPSAGVDNHTSAGGIDAFLIKINSDGTYGWAKTMGGVSSEEAESVMTDSIGNVYVTGNFSGTTDFDPSASVDNYTTVGSNDFYLTKINADGTYGWTKTMGDSGNDVARSGYADSADNVYIVGRMSNSGIFLTRINSDGTYGWTKNMGGGSGGEPQSVAMDRTGNIYVAGHFSGSSDFDPSVDIDNHTSAGYLDVFLTKFTPNSKAIANDGSLSADEDVLTVGTLTGSDIDGDSLTYSKVSGPANGFVIVTSNTLGTYTYTSNLNFNGSDSFTFKANDGLGDSIVATINITVNPINDPPTATAPDINTYINTEGLSQIAVSDPDVGDSYTYAVINSAGNGSSLVNASGLVTYSPNLDYNGVDSFEVEVKDSGGLTGTVVVNINVTSVDSTAPADGTLDIIPGNSSAALSWSGFTDDLGDISYTVVMETGTFLPSSTCSTGVTVYTGTASSTALGLLNGTTYNMRLCATDSAGNTSDGVTGTAVPFGAVDGITFAGDDENANGLVRSDGGSDANNLDLSTGKPMADAGFVFKIVVQDEVSGAPPLSIKLYVEDRTTPDVYTPYDMSCSGDYVQGQLCTYSTLLGAASAGSYYFEVVLGDIPGTVLTTSVFNMPLTELLSGYVLVGAARDIDASNLLAADIGCTDPNSIYRWVSEGLSKQSGNKGAYVLVDGTLPLKTGEGYFLNTATCLPSIAELAAEADVNSATFEVTLQAGWNIVSNPYNGNVLLSNIEVQKDVDVPMTWTDAVTNGLTINGIYYYNGSDWGKTYVVQSAGGTPDAMLAPWVGYWLYLKKDDGVYKLIVPKP